MGISTDQAIHNTLMAVGTGSNNVPGNSLSGSSSVVRNA